MFCGSCGKELPEDAGVCPSCGCDPKSGGKFCHICGAAITDGAVWHCSWAFCRSCATAIRENSDTLPTKAEVATLADYVELKQGGRRGAPMGTLGLIGLCVLVFILELCRFGWDPSAADLLAMGGNCGKQVFGKGEVWRLLSACFLHGGVFHLTMNMWCLWAFGRLLEKMTGTLSMIALFVVCGLGGAVCSAYANPEVVSVGASGAIFGLVGAMTTYAYCAFEKAPSHLLWRFMRQNVWFLLVNLFIAFRVNHHLGATIDIIAHIGGFGIGLIAGIVFGKTNPWLLSLEKGFHGCRRRIPHANVWCALGVLVLTFLLALMTHDPEATERWEKYCEYNRYVRGVEELLPSGQVVLRRDCGWDVIDKNGNLDQKKIDRLLAEARRKQEEEYVALYGEAHRPLDGVVWAVGICIAALLFFWPMIVKKVKQFWVEKVYEQKENG